MDTRHFRLTLLDKQVYDLWFTTGEQPVLTRLVTTTAIPIDSERVIRLTTTGAFKWQVGVKHPEGTFALEIPAGARRVNDLLAALQEGDIGQLLGQPAPALELTSLQGTQVNLAQHLGKNVVVLVFWASWCAPSTDRMGSLNEFVASCEKAGAAVYAINLREDRDVVSKTVADRGFQGTVLLDPQEKAVQAYRISALPVTVMIGKDGTVQAYQTGQQRSVSRAYPSRCGGLDVRQDCLCQKDRNPTISRFPATAILGRMVIRWGQGTARFQSFDCRISLPGQPAVVG